MRGMFPEAQFLMLEGNADMSKYLDKVGAPYKISLIGDVDGKEITYVFTEPASCTDARYSTRRSPARVCAVCSYSPTNIPPRASYMGV